MTLRWSTGDTFWGSARLCNFTFADLYLTDPLGFQGFRHCLRNLVFPRHIRSVAPASHCPSRLIVDSTWFMGIREDVSVSPRQCVNAPVWQPSNSISAASLVSSGTLEPSACSGITIGTSNGAFDVCFRCVGSGVFVVTIFVTY